MRTRCSCSACPAPWSTWDTEKTPSDTLSVWVAEDKRLDETQQSVCDIWSSELLHTVFIILYQSAGVDCVEAEVISQR